MAAEITVDYAFRSGRKAGIGHRQIQTANPPGGVISALLGDIEGVLKNKHGEDCHVFWWTMRVICEAKEPTQEGRL